MNARAKKTLVTGICLALVVLVGCVFGRTLGHEFVNFDDDEYVYDNPQVSGGLTLQGIAWAFTHVHSSNWHPLTWLSHMLDCELYGLKPGGPHLTNVVLHAATSVLLFLALLQLTRPAAVSDGRVIWCSALAAAVFAIHPLRVESVAWISERKDVLSGLFFVLTLMAWAGHVNSRNLNAEIRNPKEIRNPNAEFFRSPFYWLALLFFALGLMSKPMLVTLPFVLLLLDWWPLGRCQVSGARCQVSGERASALRRRSSLLDLVVEKIPLLFLSAGSCVATVLAQKQAIASLPLSLRLGNAPVSCVVYLKQLFYPANLAAYYPYPESLALRTVAGAIILLLAVSVVAIVMRRRWPWLWVGWLWYLGMLIPVIGVLQVGSQAHADRYTYLPQIGLALAFVWTAAEVCAGWRFGRLILSACSVAIVAALLCVARAQTAGWANSESLWVHTLACTSDQNVVAHNNLGSALLQKGDVDGAIAQLQRALEIKPDYADARVNLGNALLQKGKVNEAIACYHEALQIAPDEAGAHFNLGNALLRKQRVDEAIGQYQRAIEIRPDYAEAHNHLGNALLERKDFDEAIAHYQSALKINPRSAKACNNLGYALLRKGCVDEAIVQLQRALMFEPDNPEAHYNLGNASVQKRDLERAIAHYERAVQIEPGRVEIRYQLARVFLAKGDVNRAVAELRRVLEIEPDHSAAQNDLAWLWATASDASLRDGGKAVELARRANQLAGGGNPAVLRTLAAAYAEAGQFNEAANSAQKAIALAHASGRTDLIEELNGNLRLYQAGVPLHCASQ